MATALITGAARGIGLEMARQLQARGDHVLAACRRASAPLTALGAEIIEGVDVATDAGIETLRRAVDGPLDLLVNNAGILERDGFESFEPEALRRHFEVNSVAPLRVTRALRPRLKSGAKVALITSLMGSIGDNGSGGYYAYRMSKAALNMAGVSLARDLAPSGIHVALLHPGMVATEMTSGRGIEVSEAVRGLLAQIDALDAGRSGQFWHQNGTPLPW